ncbi:MAG: Hpt domain-containing protein, partial [bacterium]|nr:Hpt domain-containing protein [bacterium]
ALKDALEKKEAALARRHAHTIKGASSSIGAFAIQKVSSQIDTAAESGNVAKATTFLADLDTEFERLKITFEKDTE